MRCIIIDDEYLAIEEVKYFIEKFSNIKVVGEFDNSLSALKYIEKNKVDVIFLDINMPNLDGMSFAKIISRFEIKPKIVFVTAYKEYAFDAFEVEAFDYILKPYSEDRIISTLVKLDKNSKSVIKNKKITLHNQQKMIVVSINDISYCKASERETLVYVETKEYVTHMSISNFYDKLENEKFFKSHRSYIINVDKIKEIIPWFNNTYNLKLENVDELIPVSRSNIEQFRQIMGIKDMK